MDMTFINDLVTTHNALIDGIGKKLDELLKNDPTRKEIKNFHARLENDGIGNATRVDDMKKIDGFCYEITGRLRYPDHPPTRVKMIATGDEHAMEFIIHDVNEHGCHEAYKHDFTLGENLFYHFKVKILNNDEFAMHVQSLASEIDVQRGTLGEQQAREYSKFVEKLDSAWNEYTALRKRMGKKIFDERLHDKIAKILDESAGFIKNNIDSFKGHWFFESIGNEIAKFKLIRYDESSSSLVFLMIYEHEQRGGMEIMTRKERGFGNPMLPPGEEDRLDGVVSNFFYMATR